MRAFLPSVSTFSILVKKFPTKVSERERAGLNLSCSIVRYGETVLCALTDNILGAALLVCIARTLTRLVQGSSNKIILALLAQKQ